MDAIEREKPLHGQPLDDVLPGHGRRRGRLLLRADEPAAQVGLVLETIHYALAVGRAHEHGEHEAMKTRLHATCVEGRDRCSATARWARS